MQHRGLSLSACVSAALPKPAWPPWGGQGSGAVLAAREMAQMGSALATGLERLRRPVIVHPGTLAEHVVFLIVSSFLDSASIFRNPLNLTRRSIVALLALRPSITVSHCSRYWSRQPQPVPTLTHHHRLFLWRKQQIIRHAHQLMMLAFRCWRG